MERIGTFCEKCRNVICKCAEAEVYRQAAVNKLLPDKLYCKDKLTELPFTHVLKTIELIRDSFEGSQIVYTQGSCVKFAMILKHIYPTGEILYDLSHAIFEYDNKCFDINGFANKNENHMPLQNYGIIQSYYSMSVKHLINKKERDKVVTRLIKTLNKYWQLKDINKVIHFANRLKKVSESIV